MDTYLCQHSLALGDDCEECHYATRVSQLELEGLTTSDAQSAADVEFDRFPANGGQR
jgi:hypothetical protein